MYNEAVAEVIRQGAPLSTYSIDRRCLRNFSEFLADENVNALICFSCARRFPYLSSRSVNDIEWVRLTSSVTTTGQQPEQVEHRFCGMTASQTESIFGLQTYIGRYGKCPGEGMPDLSSNMHEFEDWQLNVPLNGRVVEILCCPEDQRCDQ